MPDGSSGPDLARRPGRLPGGSDASAEPSILIDSGGKMHIKAEKLKNSKKAGHGSLGARSDRN